VTRWVLATAVVLLAGCSSTAGGDGGAVGTSSSSPAASPSASPSSSPSASPSASPSSSPSRSPSGSPSSTPMGKPRWQLLASWRRGQPDSLGVTDGTHLLLRGAVATGPGFSTVTAHGRRILRHSPGGGQWQTQDGWLGAGRAVFLDVNLPQRNARLTVYSLSSGRRVRTVPHVGPEADVDGRQLAYFTGTPDTRMCLHAVDLATMTGNTACDSSGAILGDIATYDGSAVYSRLVDPDRPGRCKTLAVLDLRTGARDRAAERAIARHAHCLAWDGVRVAGGVAWDEADPSSSSMGRSPAFARTADGAVVGLGHLDTDSMVACGRSLYWTRTSGDTVVVRWPGRGTPQVVLDPGRNALPTALQCTDDRWLTTRVDDIGGQDERLRLLALDAG
jgi:hypothetical protein